ncbi:winged helix-turn-helix domain-containing protein [Natronorubrum halophilum]|uniref:winged helix-turn-helix domain-containing protein n=1 Tax=Natronorubrum halophilum TaxID=1702106 RepID=UPI0010C16684|nr:winged helix-turn-helix domain-containing protein [Natronorubrum halophilum]
MSMQASNTRTESTPESSAQLDVLGDECARTILIATSEGPKTAKELTKRTDSSSATVYRRINNLLESDLLSECVRFDDDGSHTTAYEATIETLRIQIRSDGIDVSVSRVEE